MNTIKYLTNPDLAPLLIPGIVTALAMAVMCSSLSVLVVLKRLSFIGQGISHAAFGGMGVAAILGLTLVGASAVGQFGVVITFCLAAAIIIGWISNRGSTSADTAIGIVLVASMCLGGILLPLAVRRQGSAGPGWESILFGSVLYVKVGQAWMASVAAAGVVAAMWWLRRPLLFWAFDEAAAPAFGVPSVAMKYVLLVLLCLAIVTAMTVSGVVLATAMLVLPAASALCLSDRLWKVFGASLAVGLLGVVGGIVVSMELEWPPGSSVVAVLTVLFAMCRVFESVVGHSSRGPGAADPGPA